MFNEMYNGSYYTIVGCGGDLKEWTDGYEKMLREEGIGCPVKWVQFTGKDMNEFYKLKGNVAYDDDIQFLAFPLDGLDVGKLAMFKLTMQDRWFDDIVENNRDAMQGAE